MASMYNGSVTTPEAKSAPRKTLPADPARWTTGDWSFEDEWDEDEDWARPEPPDTPEEKKRLHRRIGTPAELEAVADAIVRGYEITDTDPRGQTRVIVGTVGDPAQPWTQGHGLSEHVVVESLRDLIDAVQSHEAVRLARTEIATGSGAEEHVVRWSARDRAMVEQPDTKPPTVLRLSHTLVAATGQKPGDDEVLDIRLALWLEARFRADADFSGARFHADTDFWEARFHTGANFVEACFQANADFEEARFHADADFLLARFHAHALFGWARFHADADFSGARFHADADFGWASFHARAKFSWTRFHSGAAIDGDLRRADVRATKVVPTIRDNPDLAAPRRIVPLLLRMPGRGRDGLHWLLGGVRWTLLRSIGELSFLARLSVFALILVPPLASTWPAIRAGIVGYNHALDDAAARFNEAAEALHEAAGNLPDGQMERARTAVSEIEASVRDWSHRFEGMTVDNLDLPWSLALAFFAAAFITLGQLVYQMGAPSTIRKRDEDEFIEWMHERYGDDTSDRDDGLRRACEWLAAAAKVDRRRHANLIEHHREIVWVPPKERLDWFEDVEFTRADTPEGYLPAAVRRRIAIEEGARAEYYMASRENPVGVWLCFVFYALGMAALLGILYVQGMHVWRAAGWPNLAIPIAIILGVVLLASLAVAWGRKKARQERRA